MKFPLQDRDCELHETSDISHESPKGIGRGRDQRWKAPLKKTHQTQWKHNKKRDRQIQKRNKSTCTERTYGHQEWHLKIEQ
jgi:hypothetical protein